jgi:cold-inducible RNA-binding protein
LIASAQTQEEISLKKIFVGNLDFGATEESLRALFDRYGAVTNVDLVKERDTGRSRGFAFVEMAESSEADKAITALNGTQLGGRALSFSEARPKVARAGYGVGARN